VVEILTQEEIGRVLGCIDQNTASGARNYAILILLLDTGLRCSEMLNMELEDVNIGGGYLKVMGKGGKERIVPFGASVQKALLRYLLHFRPEPFNLSLQNFFLTLDGKPLTKNSIKMIFQRIAHKSGVKRLHPHLCRHTFATSYLINGGDVFSLQQILGHTTLEMVRRYVTLASAHVTVQHRKFSPMDRLSLAKTELPLMERRSKKTTGGAKPTRTAMKLLTALR
jgi:integrase/recombinase XerC/integrase/recombinase XerD